ncbi:MAG: 2-dehydropantoate 2-reductase [Gammaproteobacteria bacterium]|jgi:2-dehydropantoate 2-reductase
MRIAVYGSGGVGAYFGGRLAEAGNDVSFIARGDHLKALQSKGLSISSIAGDFELKQVVATENPSEIGAVDYVICAVKSWQMPMAAKAMKPLIGDNTLVIPLQNGVDAPDVLSDELGDEHVLGGLCALIAFKSAPGEIKHIGANPLIRFGRLDGKADSRVNLLSEVFNRCAGAKSSIPENITRAMWQKFMLITPWSGLGAISRAPIGILLQQPETREVLTEAMQEILDLATAKEIIMPDDMIANTLKLLDGFPSNSTTSMQRDIESQKPSELDYQNGTVVRLAKEFNLQVPVNRLIYYALRSTELRARGALKF